MGFVSMKTALLFLSFALGATVTQSRADVYADFKDESESLKDKIDSQTSDLAKKKKECDRYRNEEKISDTDANSLCNACSNKQASSCTAHDYELVGIPISKISDVTTPDKPGEQNAMTSDGGNCLAIWDGIPPEEQVAPVAWGISSKCYAAMKRCPAVKYKDLAIQCDRQVEALEADIKKNQEARSAVLKDLRAYRKDCPLCDALRPPEKKFGDYLVSAMQTLAPPAMMLIQSGMYNNMLDSYSGLYLKNLEACRTVGIPCDNPMMANIWGNCGTGLCGGQMMGLFGNMGQMGQMGIMNCGFNPCGQFGQMGQMGQMGMMSGPFGGAIGIGSVFAGIYSGALGQMGNPCISMGIPCGGQFGQFGQFGNMGQFGQFGTMGAPFGQMGQMGGCMGCMGQMGQFGQFGTMGAPFGQMGQMGGCMGCMGQMGQFGQFGQFGQMGQMGQFGQFGQMGQMGMYGPQYQSYMQQSMNTQMLNYQRSIQQQQNAMLAQQQMAEAQYRYYQTLQGGMGSPFGMYNGGMSGFTQDPMGGQGGPRTF